MLHAAAAATSGVPLADWLSRAGATAIMALVIVAFFKGWIVPRSALLDANKTIERVIGERNRALDLVFKQAEIAQRALDTAERKV